MKRTIGLLTAVALSGAAYAQDVKVGGYVDGGFNWTKDADPSSKFTTNDWSVTISGNSGGSFGFIEFGTGLAGQVEQFYGGHKYEGGLTWKVGAFNGLLGSEDNESPNRYFIHEGLVSGAFVQTYGGLHINYAASDTLALDLVVGNGAPNLTDLGKPMYAVKVSTKMDDVSAYVGAEFQEDLNGSGDTESDYNIDLGVHAKMGEMHVGAEVGMAKANGGDSGFAFGVHAGMGVMENVELLARFDWANENFGTAGDKAWELTVGPTFKLSDAFNIRAQYTMEKVGEGDAASMLDVMGVYKF